MAKEEDSNCTYLYGCSARKDLLGILTSPDSLPNGYQYTRFYMFNPLKNKWVVQEYKFDTRSVLHWVVTNKDYKAWWLLGKNGEIVELTANGSNVAQISGAGLHGNADDLGYVERIKLIGDDLYVCGLMRQVYKHNNGEWNLISGDILLDNNTYPRGFTDLEGFDENNIYVIGEEGEIFFYDGEIWKQENSGTNAALNVITLYSSKKVLIAGCYGVVMLGYHGHWQHFKFDQPVEGLDDDDPEGRDWWGATVYNDTIYLTGDQGIWTLDIKTEEFTPVDIPIKKNYSSHQLFSREGCLWSLGGKDILMFDGKKWQEIICPDNE